MGWSSHETLGVKVKMSVPFFCGTDISFFLILYSKGLFVVLALFSLKTNFFLLRKKASSACYTFAPEIMMEFVAERFRSKVVALVYAGSNPA